jgi:hypothetical protein
MGFTFKKIGSEIKLKSGQKITEIKVTSPKDQNFDFNKIQVMAVPEIHGNKVLNDGVYAIYDTCIFRDEYLDIVVITNNEAHYEFNVKNSNAAKEQRNFPNSFKFKNIETIKRFRDVYHGSLL